MQPTRPLLLLLSAPAFKVFPSALYSGEVREPWLHFFSTQFWNLKCIYGGKYIIDCLLQFEIWFIKELCYRYTNSRALIYSEITRGCFRERSDFRIRDSISTRSSFNLDFNIVNLLYNIWSLSLKYWWIIVALKLATQPERRLPAGRRRQTGGGHLLVSWAPAGVGPCRPSHSPTFRTAFA